MAASEDHALAFELWSDFNSKTVSNVELSAKLLLQQTHPGYHVTRTTSVGCDLMGYANAGHATATRDNTGGLSDAARLFRTGSGSRMQEVDLGKVEDQVDFGKWLYTWSNLDFIVYMVSDPKQRNSGQLLFVLSKSADGLVGKEGHHVHTDSLLLEAGRWTKVLHDEIYVFDETRWRKDKNLFESVQGASWDNVVLEPVMKRNLIKDVLTFFDNQALYQSLSVPWKRGIIFHGLPGNGKTISIKALINSLDARSPPVPSLYVKSSDGRNGHRCIKEIFSQARRQAPCLLIFEDLDSLVEDKTRSCFLNEVDGLESNEGILIIGSTNHLEKLDPAITKRPSRFDRKYHFKVPDEASRASYAEFWARKFAEREDVDFPDEICPLIAKLTADFSFAYLQELFLTSILSLARGDDEEEYQEEDEDDEEEDFGAPSDSGSTTDAVVVSHPIPGSKDNGSNANLPATTTEGESKNESEENEKPLPLLPAPKPKRVLPVVEIPEHLQDHRLLKIIKKQAKMLLEEMDSASSSAGSGGEDGNGPSRRKARNHRIIGRY